MLTNNDLSAFRSFGEYLRARINASGRSDRALSAEMGLSPSYLNNLINGYNSPSMDALRQIAEFFGDDATAIARLAGKLPQEADAERVTVADLIADYIARSLAQAPHGRATINRSNPPTASFQMGHTQVPIYLPSTADRYTPEQIAALFEEFLTTIL